MSEVQRHYDDLLAACYSWMSGMTFADKVAEQVALLKDLGLPTSSRTLAVDLGCGPGYQSAALCDLGYARVVALDTSETLLNELTTQCDGRPVVTHRQDMRRFSTLVGDGAADVVVCMGDTLTHLESRDDVSIMFHDAHAALRPGGRLVLTFRDFSTALTGTDRFIPVRADDQRIMTCALLYEADHVVVNDLVHHREDDGWRLEKSSYRKLRLAPAAVADDLRAIGFVVERETVSNRMHAIAARKA